MFIEATTSNNNNTMSDSSITRVKIAIACNGTNMAVSDNDNNSGTRVSLATTCNNLDRTMFDNLLSKSFHCDIPVTI